MAQTRLTYDEPPAGGLKLGRKLGQWIFVDVDTGEQTQRLLVRVDAIDPATGDHRLALIGNLGIFRPVQPDHEPALLTPPDTKGLRVGRRFGQWLVLDLTLGEGDDPMTLREHNRKALGLPARELRIRLDEYDPENGYHRLHILGDRDTFLVIREEQEVG